MVTKHFQVRKYKKSDLNNIEQLFRTHCDAHYVLARRLMFDWISSSNPVAGNEFYLVIEDNKKIIAHMGRMPVDLMINGKKDRGYFFHDLLVHPEYRKKGLGILLSNCLHKAWEDMTATLAIGIWINEFTNAYYKRRGYYQLNTYSFIRPLNLKYSLQRLIKNRFVVRVITPFGIVLSGLYELFISKHRCPNVFISQVEKFDERFDTFAGEISRKFAIIVLRHSKYLNWKYIDKPFANYIVLTAERDKKLTGYIVLRSRKNGDSRVGVIADILADPDDSETITSLCQGAIGFFKEKNVDFIHCLLTNKNFIRIFKKYLFFKNREIKPVMILNLHKHHAQEVITNIDNWFLTFGDSDAEMWD